MGIYIGSIDKIGYDQAKYYNFKPLIELKENDLYILTSEDRQRILPESEKENINISYYFYDDAQRYKMEEFFAPEMLVVFEFELEDLLDNLSKGERNSTGYKVNGAEIIESKKVRRLSEVDVSLLISKENILSNLLSENIVEITSTGLHKDAKVFVETDDELLAGPFKADFREYDKIYYIRPQIKENKFTISGYSKHDCIIKTINSLTQENYIWTLVLSKKEVEKVYKDMISDKELLISFKESISDDTLKNGLLNFNDIDQLFNQFKNSPLLGSPLSKTIRMSRLTRIIDIITSERELEDTMKLISEILGDSLGALIIKYQDTPDIENLIKIILDQQPDLLDRVQNSRIIKEEIAKVEQDLVKLTLEKEKVNQDLINLNKSTEELEKLVIDQKIKEMADIDDLYMKKNNQLEQVIKKLNLLNEIDDMTEQHGKLEESIKDINTHKRLLEEGTKRIETDFLSIINSHHDRMLNITFDGFMANKILKAAAGWESEEYEQFYENTIKEVNQTDSYDMAPEEIIDYLCNMVKIARTQYTSNEIINIAICIFQNFLTVFSGEPGCGKTSICNIFAEVIGLNSFNVDIGTDKKVVIDSNRYITVSVERGWTSKRDLIGYYNPLSKTFDKSNRRIFDGLKILDLEKKNKMSKYPFLILLDEANLSPMEYYWADFMNICDDLNENSNINLGDEYTFEVSNTLHFLATINNDHTTETLSPRLIDRAWIITLPQYSYIGTGQKIPKNEIKRISWESLTNTFIPMDNVIKPFTPEILLIYKDKLLPHLIKQRIQISARTDIGIKRYWTVASERFKSEEYISSSIIALDFAIAQKILPKISGSGDEFAKWLEEFRAICNNSYLNFSANIIKEMLKKGNDQMGYYQFFN